MKIKILRTATIYIFANTISAAIPFAIIPILTRLLSPEEYGMLGLFNIVTSLALALIGMSLHGAVFSKYFNSEHNDLPNYIYTCFTILTINLILSITASLIIYIFTYEHIEYPLFFIISPILIAFFQTTINIKLSLYQAENLAIKYTTLLIARVFFDSLITVLLIYLLSLSWQGRALGQIISLSIISIVSTFIIFKRYKLLKSTAEIKIIKEILAFSLPLLPHALAGTIILMNDRLVITALIDLSSAGKYFASFQICMVVLIIFDAINKAYSPWLMRQLKDININIKQKIVRSTYVIFILYIITANICAFMIIEFQEKILGVDFTLPNSSIILIANSFAFTGFYYMVVNYIFFERKTNILAMITISVATLHLPIAYILIDNYGILGASLGYMITQFLIFILTWVYSNKIYPMPWFSLNKVENINHGK